MSLKQAEPAAPPPPQTQSRTGRFTLHSLALRYPGPIAIGFLAAVVAGVFWRHLFQGFTFPWDFTATSRWAVFVTSVVAAGDFSEWVPFVGAGFPIAQCAVCGLYSPLWWAMGALHVPATVAVQTWIQVLHVLLGAAGVLALARTHRIPWRWALLAATSFTFFGGLYGNASHDVILRGHTYAPWLLWTLTLSSERPARRIVGLPLLIWGVATAGYPGQAVAFLIAGSIYLSVQIWSTPGLLRRHGPVLVPALAACLAVLGAVYLPYLAAERNGELFRPYPPAAQERAIWSLHPVDLFGLFLNPFAWKRDAATIAAWAVGAVVLVGVACARRKEWSGQAPLAAAGGVAALLAFLPSWPPAGRLMAAVPLVFPSRLPASDYKAIVAVALVILSALGWRRVASGGTAGLVPALMGAVVLAGLLFAPESRSVPPTKLPVLVLAVVAGCLLLVYRGRRLPAGRVFALVLFLTLVEGARVINDMEILPGQKAWALAAEDFPQRGLHDRQAAELRRQLHNSPPSRPARALPISPDVPGGTAEDAIGYLGAEYRLGDYGGTITIARHRIAENPRLTELMLGPWTAWVVPCSRVECSLAHVPVPEGLERFESGRVRTTAYGTDRIDYRVDLNEPSLLIENEIPSPGWTASRAGIRQVEVGGALRGWALPAGEYEFRAVYRQPERTKQLLLAAFAAAGVLAALVVYRRGPAG